jgi:hypothetical protein
MWNQPLALTPEEQKIAARTRKTRKFVVLRRERRHDLPDAAFQTTRVNRERLEPGGTAPVEAGVLALATRWQTYCHVGDREAVEFTVMGKRWQRVLDCLGAERPPFSQGTLFNFRRRLMHTMWRRSCWRGRWQWQSRRGASAPGSGARPRARRRGVARARARLR